MPSTDKQLPIQDNEPAVNMTQLMQLMKGFAQELKAPSAEDQEKKDTEKAKKQENMRILINEAKDYERNMISTQAMCAHNNGRNHTFVGQVFANGDAVAMCQICRKDFKWKATMEQLQQGVDPHQWPMAKEDNFRQLERIYPPTIPAERVKRSIQAGKSEKEALAV